MCTKEKQALQNFINSLPLDRKLKAQQFQWRLEAELGKYKDSVARMNKMVEIFWDGVIKFKNTL